MAFIRSGGFRVLLALVLLLAFGTGAGAAFVYATFLRDLPDLRSVEDYQPALTSRVLDYNGKLIGSYATERRELVPLGSLPDHVGLAFVAAEDSHFFEHSGIDYMSILRAAWVDIRAGGIKQGASTITMQLVKQMLLSPERLFSRKLREMVLARKIESHFTKDEILYLYLNQIYFGAGAWGIGEAAQTYFAKPASELTVSESALLAGLPQRPSAYSPFVNPDLAERRRLYVLGRMRDDEIISEELYAQELASPPVLAARESDQNVAAAKHFTEEVRRYLFERLGGDQVLEGGLVIETTLDIELQKVAVEAVRRGLEDHDRRRGYRGPVRQVPPADLASEIEKLGEANKLLPELEETEPENESDSEAETEDETVQLAKTGSEPELELSAPEMLQPRIPRALEIGEIVEGVVVKVDPDLDTALIAFAPGVEGQVALDDVAWARKADVKSRPRPVTRIKSIFSVGDVANFVRLEGDPLVAPEEPEEKEKEKEKVAAESDEPGLEEPEEAVPGGRDRRRASHGRRIRLRSQSVQPRHTGTATTRLGLQTVHLRRCALARLHARVHPVRPTGGLRRSRFGFRLASAELRSTFLRPDAHALSPGALGQQRNRAPVPRCRRRLRDRLLAQARDSVTAESRSLVGTRFELRRVGGVDERLRGLPQPGTACDSALHYEGHRPQGKHTARGRPTRTGAPTAPASPRVRGRRRARVQ